MASLTYDGILITNTADFEDAVVLAASQNNQALSTKDVSLQWRGDGPCLISVNRATKPPKNKDSVVLKWGESIFAKNVSKIWIKGSGSLTPHEDV